MKTKIDKVYFIQLMNLNKVLEFMNIRMKSIYEEYSNNSDDPNIDSLYNWLDRIFSWCFKTVKEYSKVTFLWDETTKDAFKVLIKYINQTDIRVIVQKYSKCLYPAYSFELIDKYLKQKTKKYSSSQSSKTKDKSLKWKFDFIDIVLTIMTTFMLSQSLSNSD